MDGIAVAETPDGFTCGMGLAENSALPRRVGQTLAAMAAVLEHHMLALDLDDPASQKEYEAYSSLVRQFQETAAALAAAAGAMEGWRDLPMGRHNMKIMTNPEARAVFERFVRQKQALAALLQEQQVVENEMLAQMGQESEPGSES